MNGMTWRALVRLDTWVDLHPWRALGLILLLALSFNAGRLWTDPPTLDMGDADQYWTLALNVSHGLGYVACYSEYFPFCGPANQVTAAREPAPVLLIALIASLTHESIYAVGIVQLIINLMILIGVFCLVREFANVRVALLAALLWAFYLPAIRQVPKIGSDLLGTLSVTWGFFFFMRGRRTESARDWLAAGVFISFGALARPAVLIIAPALVVGLILWQHLTMQPMQSQVARLKAPLLFMIAVGIMQLPWIVRNYTVFGRPVIGSTLVGYNLFRHNYMLPTKDFLHYVGPDEADSAIQALLARRTDLQGTENEVQMDAVYRDEAIRIIAANPLRYALLSGYRFFTLWFNWKVSEAYGSREGAISFSEMAEQLLLLVMAIVGSRGKWQHTWPLLVSIVILVLSHMLVVGRLREILPVMSLTVSLGALGVARVGESLKNNRSKLGEIC